MYTNYIYLIILNLSMSQFILTRCTGASPVSIHTTYLYPEVFFILFQREIIKKENYLYSSKAFGVHDHFSFVTSRNICCTISPSNLKIFVC